MPHLLPLALALALDAATPTASAEPPPQRLVVVTPSWSADAGRAVLLEGARVVLGPVPIRVGRSGLGWGLGEHAPPALDGPLKREGDGRAPAGRFRLGARWERADAHDVYCVDDVDSPLYTRIVPRPAGGGAPPWASAEHMADYRVAIVVEHNAHAARAGGSCIFLHDGVEPTAGCTAFTPDVVDALSATLRPGAELVQLPADAYRALADAWGLPPELADTLTPEEGPAR